MVFFRFCSDTSAGRLRCGQSVLRDNVPLSDDQLQLEFTNHMNLWNRTPTALVSTTDNLLRVFALAFRTDQREGDTDRSEIIFIDSPSNAKMGNSTGWWASDLARKFSLGNPKLLNSEYIFPRRIPDGLVNHRVCMDTMLSRGFRRTWLCGDHDDTQDNGIFFGVTDFSRTIRDAWKDMSFFDRGYHAGAIACKMGYTLLTKEIAQRIASWTLPAIFEEDFADHFPHRYDVDDDDKYWLHRGIDEAMQSHGEAIAENIGELRAAMKELDEAEESMQDAYRDAIGDTLCGVFEDLDDLLWALELVHTKFGRQTAELVRQWSDLQTQIGY